jgi:hypothetical protein
MKLKLVVAIAAVVALPGLALAQAQQQGGAPNAPKPTKADAQKVVAIIKGDKAKTQAFCQLGQINDQMAEADQKKDEKKLEALGKQADALAQKIGPEYVNLMDGLDQVDENSPAGKDIAATLGQLDSVCGAGR